MSKWIRSLWSFLAMGSILIAGSGDALGGEKAAKVGPDGIKVEGELKEDDPKTMVDLGVVKTTIISAKKLVRFEKGLRYVITMRSKKIDSVLAVQDAKGDQVAANDDFDEYDSQVVLIPRESADHWVVACSLGSRPGPYLLTIESSKVNLVDGKIVYDPAKGPLILDGLLTKEELKQVVQVKLQGGKTYRFDLRSKVFDSFLVLLGPDGMKLEEDDDGGERYDSRITFRAPADGTYRLVASSLGMSRPGSYDLSIREEK